MDPKISILIPVYNSAQYLRRCLNSAVKQSYKNIEVICIDDASKDGSIMILQEYANKDNRVKVLRNKANKGIAYNRNKLIESATGDYLCFLDSDDWLSRNICKKFVKKQRKQECDIAVAKTWVVFQKYAHLPFKFFPTSNIKRKQTNIQYIKKNISLCWGCFINKKFWNSLNVKFNESKDVQKFEDLGLMPYVYAKATRFIPITNYGYHYFRRKNSTSNFEGNNFQGLHDVASQADYLLSLFKKDGMITKKNRHIIDACLYPCLGFMYFYKTPENYEDKLIYEKCKAELMYVVKKKYGLKGGTIRSSWWKRILVILFKVNYRKFKFN